MRLMLAAALAAVSLVAGLGTVSAEEGDPPPELGWRWTYDSEGRVATAIDPGGRTTRFSYETDGRGRPTGISRRAPDGSMTSWTFDRLGRLKSMVDEAGTTTWRYDDLGRPVEVKRTGRPAVTYAYDVLDRVRKVTVGKLLLVEYQYDYLGRIRSLRTPAGTVTYEYLTGQGIALRKLPNGIETTWHFEPGGALGRIVHAGEDRTLLAEYTHQYRPDGLLDAVRERTRRGDRVLRYEYDRAGRLVRVAGAEGDRFEYAYDGLAARARTAHGGKDLQECRSDWAGRLTSLNGKPCEHDPSGNLTSAALASGPRRFAYDALDRLHRVDDDKVTYEYDGAGNLLARVSGGVRTEFVPDPAGDTFRPLVATTDGRKPRYFLWEGDAPLAVIEDGRATWYLEDRMESARIVVGPDGKAEHRSYTPFGVGPRLPSGSDLTPGFAGLLWDGGASLYLMRARAYCPELGRFLQTDPRHRLPTGSPRDLSMYAYCGGDPVNFVDRDGAEPERIEASPSYDAFERYINGGAAYAPDAKPHFRDAVVLGLGTGMEADTEAGRQRILETMEGRFDLIETTASSSKGGGYDLADYALFGGLQASGQPRRANWTADNVVKHSGGAHLDTPGAGNIILVDPSSQRALPQSDITVPGVVSRLTALELQKGSDNSLAFGFRGTFDSNPLDGVMEVFKDVIGFARGLGDAAKNTIQDGAPFSTHAFDKHVEDLDREGKISPPHTHRRVQIQTRSGVYLYEWSDREGKYQPAGTTSELVDPGADIGPRSGLPAAGAIDADRMQQSRKLADYMMQKMQSYSAVIARHDISGGPGQVAGPGGFASQGAYDALAEIGDMSPQPVGGVYLGGAGRALGGVGQLDGIAVDAKGHLVLIAKGGEVVKLPPLRLDDVVTVFRSVYLHGQSPTVTINPLREDPRGPTMRVVHGPGTENTYVGWVLFQADRLMKCYTVGKDNVTEQPVRSVVPGYSEMLDKMFFGGIDPGKLQEEGHWERFWIVPAAARRYASGTRALTLLDVPLKVLTQKMKWADGELVDDPLGESSEGALAFTEWFTGNYGAIAGEQLLPPPGGSGLTEPVPVFSELRRIALIAAIAEKLRQQGVPLPFWMRNYEVARVPMKDFTPAHTVPREKQTGGGTLKARIYGGVRLSPPDTDVRDLERPADLRQLPAALRETARKHLERADSLEDVVLESALTAEPLEPRAIRHADRDYRIVTLPGEGTRALAPCRLAEADLVVPVPGGRSLRLVRSYHSFFRATGPWGEGWALDLPRLEEIRVPVTRGRSTAGYRFVDELVTPFDTLRARFGEVRAVPALGGSRLPVPDRRCGILALADEQPAFLSVPTTVAFLTNGDRWHFARETEEVKLPAGIRGRLLAVEEGGLLTVYERDGQGRVSRIAGLFGDGIEREISLHYSADGRLASAEGRLGKDRTTVRYTYGAGGRLSGVRSESGTRGYRYEGPWVSAVTWRDASASGSEARVQRSFRYNARGQLLEERNGEGRSVSYSPASTPDGYSLSVRDSAEPADGRSVRFDNDGRPLEARLADGARARWAYPDGGGSRLVVETPEGGAARLTESADGRRRVLELPDLPTVSAEYDESGRMLSLARNGRTVVRRHWQPDGRLERVEAEGVAFWREYGRDGLLETLTATPPGVSGEFEDWRKTKLDPAGRPVRVTDCRGLDVFIDYDDAGNVRGVINRRDGRNYGIEIDRRDDGRVRKVRSSRGEEDYAYSDSGALIGITVKRQGKAASLRFEEGRMKSVTQFDGGVTQIDYRSDGASRGLPERIRRTDGPTIRYRYDTAARPVELEVGATSRIVLDYDTEGRVTGYSWHPPAREE